jgi:methylglutaconyl-CoA hydratase
VESVGRLEIWRARTRAAIDAELIDYTARRIAALRATPEAREGVAAFLDKRPANWLP